MAWYRMYYVYYAPTPFLRIIRNVRRFYMQFLIIDILSKLYKIHNIITEGMKILFHKFIKP